MARRAVLLPGPHADLAVMADCSHLSTMEAPMAVTHALLRLLSRRS